MSTIIRHSLFAEASFAPPRLKKEWQEDIDNPEEAIRVLKAAPIKIDLLRFWQRIPQSEAKFPYYKEWRQIAAIPIRDFKTWFEKQINPKARNKIRKAQKLGVKVEEVKLDDEFIRGVMEHLQSVARATRQTFLALWQRLRHVKDELSADLADSVFVGAYYRRN